MKSLIIYFTVAVFSIGNYPSIRVKGRKYEGYIFDSSYHVYMSIPSQKCRYAPSIDDISKAEKILSAKIDSLNTL
jgi:hypothetical protein